MNKTPGQIAFEKFYQSTADATWQDSKNKKHWESVAQSVLNSQWRSVNNPPENIYERVLIAGGGIVPEVLEFTEMWPSHTHWMPIPKPPKSKNREDFEEWAHATGIETEKNKEIAWKAWQAARANK